MMMVVSTPNANDLSSSMDQYDNRIHENAAARINDQQAALIGIWFIKEELISKLPKSD